jgi:hypothetical protein
MGLIIDVDFYNFFIIVMFNITTGGLFGGRITVVDIVPSTLECFEWE